MEKRFWHECAKPGCDSIFEADSPHCSACGTNNPHTLFLSPKEVLYRVWPNWKKIWTKQPPLFEAPFREVQQEERTLRLELVQILNARAQALAMGEPVPEAVLA